MSSPAPFARLALLALLSASATVFADETFAVTAFDQAEQLRKAGKWSEACALYEASYKEDPQLGVLLHLADCHEHVGRVASAAAEFGDAIDLAHKLADPREAVARKRAAALGPKLAKLHLLAPASPMPGLVVRRDGTDVTVLIGTDLPLDPGSHELVASAPGYTEWRNKIEAPAPGTILPVQVPALAKAAEPAPADPGQPPPTAAPPLPSHQGTVRIDTQADATILLDGHRVGKQHYETTVDSGTHAVQIVALGMKPYINVFFVGDHEVHDLHAMLEAEPLDQRYPARTFELGATLAPGVKLRADHPGVLAYRIELAFKVGARVSAGGFVELGSISTAGTCGFDLPGPNAMSGYDYGTRDRMTSCKFVTPGAHIQLHLSPHARIDPYAGIAAGYRVGLTKFTTYYAGQPGPTTEERFSGIVTGVRVGLDLHPTGAFDGWAVGPFVEGEVTIEGKESCDSCDGGTGATATYPTLLAGIRSSVVF